MAKRRGSKIPETGETRPKSGDIRRLRDLVPFMKPYGMVMAGATIALIFAAGATLAIGQAVRRMVDYGFSAEGGAILDQYFIALFAVFVVLAAATFGRFYLVSWLGERVVTDIRSAVYRHVIGLNPSFFEITSTGEVLSRITADTTLIQTVVGSSASIALRNILLLAGGTVMLFVTSIKLAGAVFLMVPLVVAPIIFFGRKVRRLSRESQDRLAAVSAQASETLNAVQTVQSFTQETREGARFATLAEGAFTTAVRRIRARAWLTAAVILLVFGAVDGVMWIGARDVSGGAMSGGELAAFVFYAVIVAGAVGALSEVWGDLQRAAGATERLLELLATEPHIRAPATPEKLPEPVRGSVELREVVFHYPTRPDISALGHFSLKVPPGESVALVGPSGAGKTTVFQLLLRFYDPASGTVSIDGVDLRRLAPEDARRHIGLVPQEPVMFATSARENIRYGRPEASDEAVRAAADAAAATEFLERLPEGFDTHLGERGTRLSVGQRQRIAIARAILRDPAILLLDEATSALDAESERMVQTALDRLMRDRTTIVIAHRLATVLKADRIVVMEEGQVVAIGTHQELLAEGGLYSRLAKLQFDAGVDVLETVSL